MADHSRDRLTLPRRFLEPSNSTHRQYEALRAFFVDGLPSAQAAARFGYTPGSFRVLVHQFRNQPKRDFFAPTARDGRPAGKQTRLREQVVALRKQNLSVHDISRALAREGESLSPAAVAAILKDDQRTIANRHEEASILFADMVNFTPMSAEMSPAAMVELLNEIFSHFDDLVGKHELEKIKTIGDCYMVAAGVPRPRADHAQALVQLALEMRQFVRGEPRTVIRAAEDPQLRTGWSLAPAR